MCMKRGRGERERERKKSIQCLYVMCALRGIVLFPSYLHDLKYMFMLKNNISLKYTPSTFDVRFSRLDQVMRLCSVVGSSYSMFECGFCLFVFQTASCTPPLLLTSTPGTRSS